MSATAAVCELVAIKVEPADVHDHLGGARVDQQGPVQLFARGARGSPPRKAALPATPLASTSGRP